MAALERIMTWMKDRDSGVSSRVETEALAIEAVRLTQAYAPKRTGALAASVSYVMAPDGESALIYATAPYAAFMEDGTKPHVIEARNAKALRFRGRTGFVFRKRVNHPGTKAYRFMERGIREAVEQQSRVLGIRQQIRNVLRGGS